MKITEIIEDLKRLNAYLPEDPQKNYANPLERMARELMLIREFALPSHTSLKLSFLSSCLSLR